MTAKHRKPPQRIVDSPSGPALDVQLLGLIQRYQDRQGADRLLAATPTYTQALRRQLRATDTDAQLYEQFASSIIYASASLRADASILGKNQQGQSGLWGYAISGDCPIVLLRISNPANVELARQLIQAHAYWRLQGLTVELVILGKDRDGHHPSLPEQITQLIAAGGAADQVGRPGGIVVRAADQVDDDGLTLLQAVARVIINDEDGPLAQQIGRHRFAPPPVRPARGAPAVRATGSPPAVIELPRRDLIFRNGLGGFTPDGCEYVITTVPGERTPAPWVNILANPSFGTLISESGSAHTWSENAHEFRLTPWSNDPVGDAATHLRRDSLSLSPRD